MSVFSAKAVGLCRSPQGTYDAKCSPRRNTVTHGLPFGYVPFFFLFFSFSSCMLNAAAQLQNDAHKHVTCRRNAKLLFKRIECRAFGMYFMLFCLTYNSITKTLTDHMQKLIWWQISFTTQFCHPARSEKCYHFAKNNSKFGFRCMKRQRISNSNKKRQEDKKFIEIWQPKYIVYNTTQST